MGLCTVSDIRVLTGVTDAMLSDGEIESLISFSDQQIGDDINPSDPSSTRVKHLSALLTALKIYTRPDLRGGFSVGGFSISNQQVEEALARWLADVRRIYAFYGKVLQETPARLKRV